jgi:hypothetical protein
MRRTRNPVNRGSIGLSGDGYRSVRLQLYVATGSYAIPASSAEMSPVHGTHPDICWRYRMGTEA